MIDDFECRVNTGAAATLSSPIEALMTDQGNGQYTYSFQVNNDGPISVSVTMLSQGFIKGIFYPSWTFTGTPTTIYMNQLNHDWGSGNVYGSRSDEVTATFEAYIKAPYTGTYTLYFDNDDGADLYIDGVSYPKHF